MEGGIIFVSFVLGSFWFDCFPLYFCASPRFVSYLGQESSGGWAPYLQAALMGMVLAARACVGCVVGWGGAQGGRFDVLGLSP